MVIFRIHMVMFIYVIRLLIKYIWSTFRRYGHNTFEILLYYMINNRVIQSLFKCIWSVYRRYDHTIFEILLYYMVNNRVIWSHIGYIRLVL